MSSSSPSVEIQISNNTTNITLKNARTYFIRDHCSKRPLPELSPGSRDTCSFSGDPQLWAVLGTSYISGILLYDAESFTLAIYFYNVVGHNQSSLELGLELFPGKAHLGDLGATYRRMANGTYSSSDQDIEAPQSHGTAWLSHGPTKVTATMVSDTGSKVKVVLEEGRNQGRKPRERNPRMSRETGPREVRKRQIQ